MNQRLAELAEEYWQWLLRTEPTEATYLGDMRYNDRMPSIGPAGRSRALDALRDLAGRTAALASAPGPLDEEEALTLDLLEQAIRDQIEERCHHFHQWWVDQLRGPQVWLQELLNYQPQKTDQDFADLAARYRAFGPYMEEYLENLREGVREGRTAPGVAVSRVLAQVRELLAVPLPASPLTPKGEGFDSPRKAELLAAVEGALREVVYPAFERMAAFLASHYPSRDAVGLCALPGGEAAYDFRIRRHTTTAMSAGEIHRTGLRMMDAVHEEMRAIARELGREPERSEEGTSREAGGQAGVRSALPPLSDLGREPERSEGGTSREAGGQAGVRSALPPLTDLGPDGDLASFRAGIEADPTHFPNSRQELLEGYRAILAEAVDALPRWFGRLPRVTCEVKAIEAFRERDCVAAYYYPPPDDFSRPAFYYANTFEPEKRPRYHMTALTLHEAVPGHHLQIALALEQRGLPAFRRHGDFTAFVEGWALYAERLGEEMGLYHDALSRFGMLTFQAWRIGRLVVDTGMHALGWSRQQAMDYLRENAGLPEPEIRNEIDRYIIWPGQALAYAIGMSEIQRLRRRTEARLGTDFDLPSFHDEILRHGALPLTTLQAVAERYGERSAAGTGGSPAIS